MYVLMSISLKMMVIHIEESRFVEWLEVRGLANGMRHNILQEKNIIGLLGDS